MDIYPLLEINRGFSWHTVYIQGFFGGVLAKTHFFQNAKTQFENTKTQFENAKTQFEN